MSETMTAVSLIVVVASLAFGLKQFFDGREQPEKNEDEVNPEDDRKE